MLTFQLLNTSFVGSLHSKCNCAGILDSRWRCFSETPETGAPFLAWDSVVFCLSILPCLCTRGETGPIQRNSKKKCVWRASIAFAFLWLPRAAEREPSHGPGGNLVVLSHSSLVSWQNKFWLEPAAWLWLQAAKCLLTEVKLAPLSR